MGRLASSVGWEVLERLMEVRLGFNFAGGGGQEVGHLGLRPRWKRETKLNTWDENNQW